MKKKMTAKTITLEKLDRRVSIGSGTLSEAQLKFYCDRMVEPPTGPEQATAALYGTKQRNISAMPIAVSYYAKIPRVRQIEQSGEVVFQSTSGRFVDEIFRDATEGNTDVGRIEGWAHRPCDAYNVRDEFLKVTTERQALDFLRENGEFLPYDQQISWTDFKRWQRCAEMVIERDTLSSASKAIFAGRPKNDTDPTDELKQLLLMLTGIYPHTYFGDSAPPPSQHDLEQLRRVTGITSETPRQAAEKYQETLAQMKKGAAIRHQRQQELEHWFYAPPPSAYSIEFVPKKPNPDLERNMQRGGALLDYLIDQEELLPVLVIYARCALEAIAAAIYAERVAGVRVGKCPACDKLFEIEAHKEKTFCNRQCQDKMKKDRRRKRKTLVPPPAKG
ncbi:hypothetical protein [Granulicella sp. L46]|uniref:hypothetical protein n=1 Tax=Granulicella sp. L46 TaxID=1641865 RepID=UPI00131B5D78|nr:hypothetical protein [Granulicella sp. L46]